MVEKSPPAERITRYPYTDVVAEDVPADEYMEKYAEHHYEWVKGYVVKMSPVTSTHDAVSKYLHRLLDAYFALNPIGDTRADPFVMRLDAIPSRRQPDIQVILGDNRANLTETYMDGGADICIEVVSLESTARDYGDKLIEYEKGGVREYWIIDPMRKRCTFNRLGDDGKYNIITPDDDTYHTPLLPKLALHIPTLWRGTLPHVIEIVEAVRGMMADK